ncbi:hypothetical protein NO2_0994 [Candidatus Termititenax persephonae]|uniref:Porin n=1 Tax=Candidatus Termititenax persephonae TaxID=2218525 RepID=A0A388TH43_9BACT|nr:hypothetical protein NO2_0994 [Candidatus Termititenax persephonae]
MRRSFLVFLLGLGSLLTADSLFYTEIQGVVGYSSPDQRTIYRSGQMDDAMQLNSLGFDYLQKFSGGRGDIGSAALQARLAYRADQKKTEAQIYNAYWKSKTSLGDVWFGHNRVAFGLAAYWDTHADLLQPLPMHGFGYDRDWGIGWSKDTLDGGYQAALTSGSGLPLRTDGNWLATGRIARGALGYDNYSVGLSLLTGQTPEIMGYTVMDTRLKKLALINLDAAYNYDNLEHKAEIALGRREQDDTLAVFYRCGLNLGEENRLKLEGQYVYTSVYTHARTTDNTWLGIGALYRLTAELTSRLMYEWQRALDEYKIVAQLYAYF